MKQGVSRYCPLPFRLSTLIYGRPLKRVQLKLQGYHPKGPQFELFTHPDYDPLFRLQRILEKEKRLQTL